MKVDVHIEHLLLDGVQLTRRERAELPAVVQRELHALLDAAPAGPSRDADPGPRAGDRRPRYFDSARIDHIGRDVAQAVKGALPSRGGTER
ncbi:MAG: hypothetical protein M3376_09425 [Actinomycetota bacterium]|nr:hypothetical protein [Actinomycetota bacterium]